MRGRTLIVPAAGLGSRLGSTEPKLLVEVAGEPMIDRLLALYRNAVDSVILVLHPSFEGQVRQHLAGMSVPMTYVIQATPTGMLDAIMLAKPAVENQTGGGVWITWCDQVAVDAATVRTLSSLCAAHPEAAMVMPTVPRTHPYIHLERDPSGRIVRVLHRREGDAMPEEGESDIGLFALSAESFEQLLPRYAREVEAGGTTGERNFLPFIPWVARMRPLVTFPAVHEMEAVGVNTPQELRAVEEHLRHRDQKRS